MALVDTLRNQFAQGAGDAQVKYKQNQDELAAANQQQADFQSAYGRNGTGGANNGGLSTQDYMSKYGAQSGDPQGRIHKAEAQMSTLQQGDEDARRQQETYNKAAKPFEDLYQQQDARAKQFRMQFPSILDNQLSGERVNMRRGIASGISDTRKGYNSRGLLYSGLRGGAEANVGSDAASQYAATVADKTKTLNDQANSLDSDVTETGKVLGDIGNEVSGNSNSSRQALLDSLMQQSQNKDEAIGGLLGGAGKLGGTIAANLATKKKEA